jgi:SRSO17 transposase
MGQRRDKKAAEDLDACNERFEAYIDKIVNGLGHGARHEPCADYCRGLLTTPGRKSVEPMAAITEPRKTSAKHQSMLHIVGQSAWSDREMLDEVYNYVLPAMTKHEAIQAWIVDDTAFPKQGKASVGVARQYCGQLGKVDNCQDAVSLSVATHEASVPIDYRLYLTEEWAHDKERRAKCRVPKDVRFQTKPMIALAQIKAAKAREVPKAICLADAGYGANFSFRHELRKEGIIYGVGVQPTMKVQWVPTADRANTTTEDKAVRARKKILSKKPLIISVKKLAMRLPSHAWEKITWREGVDQDLASRFARVRVCCPDKKSKTFEPEEWLVIEWPEDEKEPTKYWLSTQAPDIPFAQQIDEIKLRWRIERDYQELKQEVGLGHYEGRSWTGFHHHASLCIAAYGFLISERETFPPSGQTARRHGLQESSFPKGYRPRGHAAAD